MFSPLERPQNFIKFLIILGVKKFQLAEKLLMDLNSLNQHIGLLSWKTGTINNL